MALSGHLGFCFYSAVRTPTNSVLSQILLDLFIGEAGGISLEHEALSGHLRCVVHTRRSKAVLLHLEDTLLKARVRVNIHREVKVAVGRKYSELNGFPASPYDDTTTKVSIIW